MVDTKATHYALLGFEGIELSFPQDQVLNINSIGDVQPSNTPHREVGCVSHNDSVMRVFALSADLQPKTVSTKEHRFCVSFHIDGEPLFALTCDTVESLTIDKGASIQPLPELMKLDFTPIHWLLRHEEKLALLTDVGAMHAYLGQVGAWDE